MTTYLRCPEQPDLEDLGASIKSIAQLTRDEHGGGLFLAAADQRRTR